MDKPLSLVTGACGFMGSHMVEILHEAGHQVRATDLEQAYVKDDKERQFYPSILKKLNVEFIPADLTKVETLKSLFADVKYVFHVAGLFNYTAPYQQLRKVNVEGTRNLLSVIEGRKNIQRFVFWGAGGVYGLPSSRGNVQFTEDLAPMPSNDYLRSKWEAEYEVMEWGRLKKLPYTIIRPTTVYGPRQTYGGAALIFSAAQPAIPAVPANFTFHIPFVHVTDVCRAALFLATKKEAAGEIYNLNDDTRMTAVEFYKYVARLMGKFPLVLPPIHIGLVKSLLGGAVGYYQQVWRLFSNRPSALEKPSIEFFGEDFWYSNEKLKNLGYEFTYPDARQGLLQTLNWYRENEWL